MQETLPTTAIPTSPPEEDQPWWTFAPGTPPDVQRRILASLYTPYKPPHKAPFYSTAPNPPSDPE